MGFGSRFRGREKLVRDLDDVHEAFFSQFDVDRATGIVRGPYVKFPAYPYVGSRYGELKKLLFVGLDIGADETCGSIQSYEGRRARIEEDSEHPNRLGPHMSGTYVTAMRLLAGENEEWRRWLEGADRELTPAGFAGRHEPTPVLESAVLHCVHELLQVFFSSRAGRSFS